MPNMGEIFTFDVFLSHSTRDKVVVSEVANRLRTDGLRVWFDEWMLRPGDSIPAKIEEGLEHSRVLVLCMSANAFGSDWAKLESGTFRFCDPLNKDRRFIPLRLDDAPIKGSLAQSRWADWHTNDPCSTMQRHAESTHGERTRFGYEPALLRKQHG
jgi:TIR domain